MLLALDSDTDKQVAVKQTYVKQPELGLPDNVVREIQTLQHLDHPNVVQLLDVFAQVIDLQPQSAMCSSCTVDVKCTPAT